MGSGFKHSSQRCSDWTSLSNLFLPPLCLNPSQMRSEGRSALAIMMTDCWPADLSASRRKCSGKGVWLTVYPHWPKPGNMLSTFHFQSHLFKKSLFLFLPESPRSWQSLLRCTRPRCLAAWHPVWWLPASWPPTLWWQAGLHWQGRGDGRLTIQL